MCRLRSVWASESGREEGGRDALTGAVPTPAPARCPERSRHAGAPAPWRTRRDGVACRDAVSDLRLYGSAARASARLQGVGVAGPQDLPSGRRQRRWSVRLVSPATARKQAESHRAVCASDPLCYRPGNGARLRRAPTCMRRSQAASGPVRAGRTGATLRHGVERPVCLSCEDEPLPAQGPEPATREGVP
jgi:hypothetical protein